jgi:hypothetical protein
LAVASSVAIAMAKGLEVPASVAIATVEMVVAAAPAEVIATPVATVEVVVTSAERAEVATAPVTGKAASVFEAVAVAPVAVTIEVAVKPRADADELASNKIRRAPVAVRRAVIRVVIIVAVWAYRRCYVTSVNGTDPDAD